ncbi:MAG: hypothetical protein WCJ56_02330 [bacterium]
MAEMDMAANLSRVWVLATVRNRRGIITSVDPYADSTGTVYHLVTIEYLDTDGDREDRLIWECEVRLPH